jgi:glycosyltransferase involved in cell wall biosynthesis
MVVPLMKEKLVLVEGFIQGFEGGLTVICFAILAHRNEDVLQNQVNNIHVCNPGAKIVLYNGGDNPNFGKSTGIEICPYSRPLKFGQLGRFFIETLRWLEETDCQYDYVVSVDSDVLFLRTGFHDFLNSYMDGYDCMGINMYTQLHRDHAPHWGPGQTMWNEWARWQPFFQTDYFCATLNCMQVYRRAIVQQIIHGIDWESLYTLLDTTQVFALEEMLLVTLAVRHGAKYRKYSNRTADYVRTGTEWSIQEVKHASHDSHAYFIHPVNRCMNDEVRSWITNHITLHENVPSSLTIVWGSYQGGVETAMFHRLRALNSVREAAHVFFYKSGAGIRTFQHIPHYVSEDQDDLLRYINLHSFDIITFVNTLDNLDIIVNSGFRGTCVFECHGFAPLILHELNRINAGEDMGRISAVVVPGFHVKAQVEAALWRRPDIEVLVAKNMVDTHEMSKRSDVHFGFKPKSWNNSKIVGWVGRLDAIKNWRLLLRIFKKLKVNNPDVKLLVTGDMINSPDLTRFFNKCQKYNLTKDLKVIPNISYKDMPEFYSVIAASGGVLLSTSLSEGYPYHLLEAQACECPVVCTLAGGSAEIVAHGATGFAFLSHNISAAVKYTEDMFNQNEIREQIVSQAREKVCTQNAVEPNAEKYIQWIRNIVGE